MDDGTGIGPVVSLAEVHAVEVDGERPADTDLPSIHERKGKS